MRKAFNRPLEEVQVVRFLRYYAVFHKQPLVQFQVVFAGKAAVGVGFLGEWAGEVQYNLLYAVLGQVAQHIFRSAVDKAQIGQVGFNCVFAGDDYHVAKLFHGYIIALGVLRSGRNGESPLAAA